MYCQSNLGNPEWYAQKCYHCFYVPYKLVRQLNGQSTTENNGGHNKALSTIQEKALLLYIDRCEERGRPCKHKHIEIVANSLLLNLALYKLFQSYRQHDL